MFIAISPATGDIPILILDLALRSLSKRSLLAGSKQRILFAKSIKQRMLTCIDGILCLFAPRPLVSAMWPSKPVSSLSLSHSQSHLPKVSSYSFMRVNLLGNGSAWLYFCWLRNYSHLMKAQLKCITCSRRRQQWLQNAESPIQKMDREDCECSSDSIWPGKSSLLC